MPRTNPFNTPWKIWNLIQAVFTWPVARMQFLINGIPWGNGYRFYGLPVIQKYRGSRIRFGDSLQLRSSVRSAPLAVDHPVFISTLVMDSEIHVGNEFGMTGGAICAVTKIEIGDRVVVGANSVIMDTDFHPSSPEQRKNEPNVGRSAPITIEDDVFIGASCYILRGVRLGAGCVVGTGSVVLQDVAPGAVVFGNPARQVGKVIPPA